MEIQRNPERLDRLARADAQHVDEVMRLVIERDQPRGIPGLGGDEAAHGGLPI